jgi:LuxR family transcriptional regulator, maltose regulon positive regulatory protein
MDFRLRSSEEIRLSSEEIAAMEVRTEGWVAGLQLAALSMQGCKDIGDFVVGFTGSHYYIMDYLTEEALKTQPEDVRSFLLQTSILNSMCASLCQSVVEIEGTESLDGQAMLEYLEKINLFVIPLDDKRQWYRYHHLFADVLNLRVEHMLPDLLPGLHRRASRWYEENGIIPEAIHHALKAGDRNQAVQLVEQNGCSLLISGQGYTLLKWVEAVDSYSQTHPWIAILKAWALALTGNFNLVEPALQKAKGLFSPDPKTFEVEIMLGSIATVRAYLANIRGEAGQAVSYAKGALEYLPDGNTFSCSLRSVATSILGDASWMNGNLEEAKQAYLEAVRISEAASNIFMAMIGNSNLADVLVEQGELNRAARIFSETLQIATRPDGQKLPLADRLYAGLSEIYYEWNRMEEAAGYIQRCRELSWQWGNTNLLAKSYVMLARLELARCHQDKAQESMRIAEQLANEQRLSDPQSVRVKFSVARLWMAQGNLERAFLLVQQLGIKFEPTLSEAEIPHHRLPEYLFLVRLLLAQGDHECALSLSRLLLSQAEASRQRRRVLETLILQALALQVKKEMEQAISVLEKAFFLAQPEGYIRIFLDEGEPLVKLLYQAKSHRFGQGYAAELLSEQGRFSEKGLLPVQPLIEPLTLREIEILRLIATGFTNQNIADQLVISIPTVKRHISNIYAKLGAKNRTQAVSLGREIRLVE